ncbi:hypothetical protein CKR_2903 [Clostridium kluyveri NBRC 12016]|uniref:Uncharacterized protein n=1 Tax=Clostridium kluyveri (strain NBRC 12016) TaxID=583346 RepID=B9E629_CLOK1|nr:hypothetical protein CKR_2903 [Clostridium kluyveri NBRC 12016]
MPSLKLRISSLLPELTFKTSSSDIATMGAIDSTPTSRPHSKSVIVDSATPLLLGFPQSSSLKSSMQNTLSILLLSMILHAFSKEMSIFSPIHPL